MRLVWIVIEQFDFYRQALNDFDEVSRRVLRRQERERLAGPHGETSDAALEFLVRAVHVHFDLGAQQGQWGSELMGGIAKKPALHFDVGIDLAKRTVKRRNKRPEFYRNFIKRNRSLRCCRVDREREPCDAFDADSHEASRQDRADHHG